LKGRKLEATTHHRVRVLIVDDHAVIRQGLHAVLDTYPDVEIVGEAAEGGEALDCVEQLQPSVVVMDISLPGMNGIEATKHIKSRFPDTAVIGLTVDASRDAEAMIKAGATELLMKEVAVDELYRAIQAAFGNR
jgi:DNA-binding NarL/FixJ family response regulator